MVADERIMAYIIIIIEYANTEATATIAPVNAVALLEIFILLLSILFIVFLLFALYPSSFLFP